LFVEQQKNNKQENIDACNDTETIKQTAGDFRKKITAHDAQKKQNKKRKSDTAAIVITVDINLPDF